MSVGVEAFAVSRWLIATLTGDATLTTALGGAKVYTAPAPEGTPLPYVTIDQLSGVDNQPLYTRRSLSRMVYLVKVFGAAQQFTDVRALATRVDALLNDGRGSNADGHVLGCTRRNQRVWSPVEEGVRRPQVWLWYDIDAEGL